MWIFDLNKIKRDKVKANLLNTKTIQININNYSSVNYVELFNSLQQQIREQLDSYKEENTVFEIICESNELLDEEDIYSIYQQCVNLIFKLYLKTGKKRNRETRLTADMYKINSCYTSWLDIINSDTVINRFNIVFKYRKMTIKLIEG